MAVQIGRSRDDWKVSTDQGSLLSPQILLGIDPNNPYKLKKDGKTKMQRSQGEVHSLIVNHSSLSSLLLLNLYPFLSLTISSLKDTSQLPLYQLIIDVPVHIMHPV